MIKALIEAPVLATPDYDLPYKIECDASDFTCGAVLLQIQDGQERVIAYMSQKFIASQRKYHVTEDECPAVILGIEKFRTYIEGSAFQVIHHHSLLWLENLKDPSRRLARWSLRLQAYDFEIIYIERGRNISFQMHFHVPRLTSSNTKVRKIIGIRNFVSFQPIKVRFMMICVSKRTSFINVSGQKVLTI